MPTPRYESNDNEPNWYPDEDVETKKVIRYDDNEKEMASGTSRVCRCLSSTFSKILDWLESAMLSIIAFFFAVPGLIYDWKEMLIFMFVCVTSGMLIGAYGIPNKEPSSVLGCEDAFNGIGYAIKNVQKYSDFFHSNSNLTVPQFGVYYGPREIAEYASFFTAASPYLAAAETVRSEMKFLGNDEDLEVCHFRTLDLTEFSLISAARDDTIFNATSMTRIIFSPKTKKIESVNVHHDVPFLDFYFKELAGTDFARDHVCSVMSDICSMKDDNCMNKMAALPISDGPYADGNSQACRFAKAASNMTWDTCAHLSFSGLADSRGAIKCQKSNLLLPDLFEKSDFEAYGMFQKSLGLIPGIGLEGNVL